MILNQCLANNAAHLQDLKLSFCWQLPVNFIFALCLKRGLQFTALQRLSLESVLFDGNCGEILDLFRAADQLSLEVIDCEGMGYFMELWKNDKLSN
jgi:hypothetical protein